MLFDLHTHTTASDGDLTPPALAQRACDAGVTHLSITDHDSVDAYAGLVPPADLAVIPGIELSTRWRKIGVHVLGLNIALDNDRLQSGIAEQQSARRARAEKIARRLMKAGIPDPLPGVLRLAGNGAVGRPHFARHLVATGVVRDTQQAFRKYLGDGKAGDVRRGWAELDTVIGWIRAAGGIAVLAHPAHYKLTATRLRELLADFRAAGGEAMEVVSGRQTGATTRKLADLASEFALLASCGSDFHRPDAHFAALGSQAPLPADCRPVWQQWVRESL